MPEESGGSSHPNAQRPRVLGFGTYATSRHPRVRILLDGLAQHGFVVREINEPLQTTTAQRVEALRQPWRVPVLAFGVLRRWWRLSVEALRHRRRWRPDVVLVGYLGHFDVLLARLLFPRTKIALDHLVFAEDTARDRGFTNSALARALRLIDSLALSSADLIILDTLEHKNLLSPRRRRRAVVVPVGATDDWFSPGEADDGARRLRHVRDCYASEPGPESCAPVAVFFGLFTPLQGAETIGAALAELSRRGIDVPVHLVGSGQDEPMVRALVERLPAVRWTSWMQEEDLRELVSTAPVCLGIFGTSAKSARVVPNKVYQGAAAGALVITSDTGPQRAALGENAIFVPAGDPEALADALQKVCELDADELHAMLNRSRSHARDHFSPRSVVVPLLAALENGGARP